MQKLEDRGVYVARGLASIRRGFKLPLAVSCVLCAVEICNPSGVLFLWLVVRVWGLSFFSLSS